MSTSVFCSVYFSFSEVKFTKSEAKVFSKYEEMLSTIAPLNDVSKLANVDSPDYISYLSKNAKKQISFRYDDEDNAIGLSANLFVGDRTYHESFILEDEKLIWSGSGDGELLDFRNSILNNSNTKHYVYEFIDTVTGSSLDPDTKWSGGIEVADKFYFTYPNTDTTITGSVINLKSNGGEAGYIVVERSGYVMRVAEFSTDGFHPLTETFKKMKQDNSLLYRIGSYKFCKYNKDGLLFDISGSEEVEEKLIPDGESELKKRIEEFSSNYFDESGVRHSSLYTAQALRLYGYEVNLRDLYTCPNSGLRFLPLKMSYFVTPTTPYSDHCTVTATFNMIRYWRHRRSIGSEFYHASGSVNQNNFATTNLYNNNPIVVGLKSSSAYGSHAVLAVGYGQANQAVPNGMYFRICDGWNDSIDNYVPYNDVDSGFYYRWW